MWGKIWYEPYMGTDNGNNNQNIQLCSPDLLCPAAPLFDRWKETMICSCLQGFMGSYSSGYNADSGMPAGGNCIQAGTWQKN